LGKIPLKRGQKELLCCAGKLYWRKARAMSGRKHQERGKKKKLEAGCSRD
jgi:hypothetical protein